MQENCLLPRLIRALPAVDRRDQVVLPQPASLVSHHSTAIPSARRVQRPRTGVWCAHAQLRPSVSANGEGATREEAVDDLREALAGLIAEFGVPDELTVAVDMV